MSATAELLAGVPLFADLDEPGRELLAERVDTIELTEGQCLWQYGDPGDYMVIVVRGCVELTVRTKTGETVFLEQVEAGEFFGEISLLDAGSRTATARVMTAGEALIVDRGDLDELLRLQPTAAMRLLRATGKRLRTNAAIVRNAAARNVNTLETDHSNAILRMADAVANASGSLPFLIVHIVIFIAWIAINATSWQFDKYPYGLLTMAVSLEAIILSTLLLFSSNRQTARDRVRSDIEYDVNLKAELQISHLHEKIDALQTDVLARLEALDPNHRVPGASRSLPADLSG